MTLTLTNSVKLDITVLQTIVIRYWLILHIFMNARIISTGYRIPIANPWERILFPLPADPNIFLFS